MALSPHLRHRLHEALGAAAAEDLVSWIEENDSVRADVAELRHEMQLGFARIEAKLEQVPLRAEMEKRFADLLKWSFVFWVGAVGAIAALAGVLK